MKQHFTATAEPEDLARLDAWAASRKLTRGKAIIELLDRATAPDPVPGSTETHAQDVRPSGVPQVFGSVNAAIPNLRSPDSKTAALAVGKALLEAAQHGPTDGRPSVEKSKKPDPPGWDDDELNQGGGS
jgi:hypothetical protein